MTKTNPATSFLTKFAIRFICPALLLGFSTFATVSAHADSWGASNGLSRVVVHAICGNPSNSHVVKDSKGCFCGGRLSYRLGFAADQFIKCDGKAVPNYAHKEMTTTRMLQELVKIFYGNKTEVWGFCMNLADNECIKKEAFKSIGSPKSDEAYFVGHLTSVLVGRENCERASQNYEPIRWAMGTSLAELSDGGIQQLQDSDGWLSKFREGCHNDDYLTVWNWIDSQ